MSDSLSEGESSQLSPNQAGASSSDKRSPTSHLRKRKRSKDSEDKILSAIAILNAKFDKQAEVIDQLRAENEQLRKAVNDPPKFDFKKQNYAKEICLSELDHMRCI